MTVLEICSLFRGGERKAEQAAEELLTRSIDELSIPEIAELARAIGESGSLLDLSPVADAFLDCPSTGGPGSMSTLIPPLILAGSNCYVPKLAAGGSLDGGIDTLSLIPNYKATLSREEMLTCLRKANLFHVAPDKTFCPADRTLIAARRRKQLMANATLAAVSLFGKKVAIPKTSVAFDFRVGPTGNIATNYQLAEDAGQLFLLVGKELGIKTSIVLTDHRTYVSSVIGRIESLELLLDMLAGTCSLAIDREHFNTCGLIAETAYQIHFPGGHPIIKLVNLREHLQLHLEAQGTSMNDLVATIERGKERSSSIFEANDSGFWTPPDLLHVKNALKKAYASLADDQLISNQIGIKLLVSPGDAVQKGQPVLEIRAPTSLVFSDTIFWAGLISSSPPEARQVPRVLN